MSDIVFIYTLADPRTGHVRYIGKAFDIDRRYSAHLKDMSRTHKVNWIKMLAKEGVTPVIEVLEVINCVCDEDWQEAERFWIASLRQAGCDLTNCDSGGVGGKKMSAESRAKISRSKKGVKMTESARAKMIEVAQRPETKARMSAASKGRGAGVARSEEVRAKTSASMKGRKFSNDHKNNIKEARARMSDESRERLRKQGASLHKHITQEVINKRAKSSKKTWQTKAEEAVLQFIQC